MDIALFHLVCEAGLSPRKRKAPCRIFFVVDRRLVVDEAFLRARRIAERLNQAEDSTDILGMAAVRLRQLAGPGGKALEVIRLRGGLPFERSFLENPRQPAIIVSTVDQVGSRLMFRGYGVSPSMRPIHAALVGMDSLIILDEAHLSLAFFETLGWIQHYQGKAWAEQPVGKGIQVVQMSGTVQDESASFRLTDTDWSHPVLSPRLTCCKPASLISVAGDPDDPQGNHKKMVEELVKEARNHLERLSESTPAPVIGVIANRVATARAIFETLAGSDNEDAILLTGRIRPVEREALIQEYLPRMKAGRSEDANPRPLFIVATQTIEVGADLDFDALITESASLDALRQRFGRLNRLGRLQTAMASIVHMNFGRKKIFDPVYGEAIKETWKWLEKHARKPRGAKHKVFDFGIASTKNLWPQGKELEKLLAPTSRPPVLMPSHVDLLAQTNPAPAVEPDVALHLHGVDAGPQDVQIVWRADLPALDNPDAEKDRMAMETVDLLPPMQQETVAVPVWVAQAFLRTQLMVDMSDTEGGKVPKNLPRTKSLRRAVRWEGEQDSRIVESHQIQPGDTIVVPAAYGGHDKFGWNPAFSAPVLDVAENVARQNGLLVLRAHPELIRQWFGPETPAEYWQPAVHGLHTVLARMEAGEDLHELCAEWLDTLLGTSGLRSETAGVLDRLRIGFQAIPYPESKPVAILFREKTVSQDVDFTDDTDESSLARRKVSLEEHCRGVAELAREYAASLIEDTELVDAIYLSGLHHDLGKADPRFQAWLAGGDPLAVSETLLAKSNHLGKHDRAASRLARELAHYPRGTRHECYSVAMLKAHEQLLPTPQGGDLILYLVGSHHGRGRPFMPAVPDPGMPRLLFRFMNKEIGFQGPHGQDLIDSGWVDLFWCCVRRFGYWGLAYLETMLRLADHRRSAQGG